MGQFYSVCNVIKREINARNYDRWDDVPTETDVNDFFWFERDEIAQLLGYNDFDEIMERNKE